MVKTFTNKGLRTKTEIVGDNNTPIYIELDRLDLKSIRAMREGDTVRMNSIEAEATELRKRLM